MNKKQVNEDVGKVAVLMREPAVRYTIIKAYFSNDKKLAKKVERYLIAECVS